VGRDEANLIRNRFEMDLVPKDPLFCWPPLSPTVENDDDGLDLIRNDLLRNDLLRNDLGLSSDGSALSDDEIARLIVDDADLEMPTFAVDLTRCNTILAIATARPPVAKPTVTKAAVTKPAVTKPAVTKPAVTKPAVTKPAVTKPAVAKPAAAKPAVALSKRRALPHVAQALRDLLPPPETPGRRRCEHCGARDPPAWRRDLLRRLLCNACGIYHQNWKRNRPLEYATTPARGRRRQK